MNNIKLILIYISANLKSQLEYKVTFFVNIFIVIIDYGGELLAITFLLKKFNSIDGWTVYEIMFLYSLNLLSYGISGFVLRNPFRSLERMVQDGSYDSILIRPMNPLLHLICREFQYLFFGHVILCGIVFALCLSKLSIVWTVTKVIYFIITLFSAIMIQGALMIIGGSLSFWIVKSQGINDVFVHGMRDFANYPITIYSKWIQLLFTFGLPYAFVNYYPAQHLFSKSGGGALFQPIFQYGAPFVGLIMIIIAKVVYTAGINRYQSTGS